VPLGHFDHFALETTGTSTALCRSYREQSQRLEPLLHLCAAIRLTLALRGIAAAYLRLQCLDPGRVVDTLFPRGVDGSIYCPLSHWLLGAAPGL
jgi:hypothetical protein